MNSTQLDENDMVMLNQADWLSKLLLETLGELYEKSSDPVSTDQWLKALMDKQIVSPFDGDILLQRIRQNRRPSRP
jgi:hypothetical protein